MRVCLGTVCYAESRDHRARCMLVHSPLAIRGADPHSRYKKWDAPNDPSRKGRRAWGVGAGDEVQPLMGSVSTPFLDADGPSDQARH